jgi:hypothetical protein
MKPAAWMLSALLAAAAWSVDADDVKLILTTDPFRKPELAEVAPIEPIVLNEAPEAVAVPRLRAIMHAPQTTLVNLDGELVAVGGRYEDFRVVAAGERNAVLLKGEDSYVVSVDDPEAEGGEDD